MIHFCIFNTRFSTGHRSQVFFTVFFSRYSSTGLRGMHLFVARVACAQDEPPSDHAHVNVPMPSVQV